MTTKKKDILNEYFTTFVNELLKQIGLDEIKPNELRNITLYSKYQGTNRPETHVFITIRNWEATINLEFKKGKLLTDGWRYLPKRVKKEEITMTTKEFLTPSNQLILDIGNSGYYKKMLDNLTDLITDEFKQTITCDDIILMAVNHLYLQLCYPTNEYQRLIRNDILNEYKTGLAPLWDTVIGNDIEILEG